jgi:hypothetical protein
VVETTTLKQAIHVTSHVGGFYINRTSPSSFDPRPAPRACAATSLVALLRQVDPQFAAALRTLMQGLSSTPALLQTPPPFDVHPWAVPSILDAFPSPSRAASTLQVALDQPEMPGQVRRRWRRRRGT